MPSDKTQELGAIVERLSKLEDQNRRLKSGGIAILVAFSAVILMGQAAPSPRIVEAQKFVLKDASGNVRGWVGIVGEGSELILGNADARPMVSLEVSANSGDLHFYGSPRSGMNLGVNSGEPSISMIDAEGNGGVEITLGKNGPSLSLKDGKGFSTAVGTTQIENPANRQAQYTSAASVVLLNKSKEVIWRAP